LHARKEARSIELGVVVVCMYYCKWQKVCLDLIKPVAWFSARWSPKFLQLRRKETIRGEREERADRDLSTPAKPGRDSDSGKRRSSSPGIYS
jgi:hypothetical protein